MSSSRSGEHGALRRPAHRQKSRRHSSSPTRLLVHEISRSDPREPNRRVWRSTNSIGVVLHQQYFNNNIIKHIIILTDIVEVEFLGVTDGFTYQESSWNDESRRNFQEVGAPPPNTGPFGDGLYDGRIGS